MKSKITPIRFKLVDYFELEEKAQKMGLTVSDYIRQAALNSKIVEKKFLSLGDAGRLSKSLGNFNQAILLAHIAAKRNDDPAFISQMNILISKCEDVKLELLKFVKEFRDDK
jgi:ribbon-helix-helix protein, copG family